MVIFLFGDCIPDPHQLLGNWEDVLTGALTSRTSDWWLTQGRERRVAPNRGRMSFSKPAGRASGSSSSDAVKTGLVIVSIGEAKRLR